MGIGGGSGGGGFKLEKTWRATGVGSTTFNTPGNFTIPFGKYDILVSGRAGTGNPDTPGNISGYNPIVPSTIAGYNAPSPSNIAGYNPISPGNATGLYNAGSGGNFAGYTQSGGNIASWNAPTPGGFNVTEYVTRYDQYFTGGTPGNPTGTFNPPSGGNIANYNPFVAGNGVFSPITPGSANYNSPSPGNQNYNPPTPGGFATITTNYSCEPTGFPGGSIIVDFFEYNSFYQVQNDGTFIQPSLPCPAPSVNYQTIPPSPGNATGVYNPPVTGSIAGYNPPSGGNLVGYNSPSGGNPNYNPLVSGTQNFNSPTPGIPPSYNTFYFNNGFSNVCPSPYTSYSGGPNFPSATYETVNYSCSPVPGSPGNPNYNAVTFTAVFNAFVPGNQNFNAATGGNANWNAAVTGNANWNAVGGQNANFNTPSGGVAGAPTNVLGVFFPGGNVGSVAPFVPPTVINRYIADDTTYPVDVPTGGYVTIQSR